MANEVLSDTSIQLGIPSENIEFFRKHTSSFICRKKAKSEESLFTFKDVAELFWDEDEENSIAGSND